MNWIEDYIKKYYDWLREKTTLVADPSSDWTMISTPYMGAFNDYIQIFAKLNNNNITLSDDGQTLSNLELAGVNITRSAKRKEHLDRILLNYGIKNQDNELLVDGVASDFNKKKHNLLSAIIEITDMASLAKPAVTSLFREDVKTYLEEQKLIYTEEFITKGATGIEFVFDFQIAGREKEIVIKSFNTLDRNNVPNFLFSWDDIKPVRARKTGKEIKGLAIVNNIEKNLRPEFIEAFKSKGADFILWSDKDKTESREKLAA